MLADAPFGAQLVHIAVHYAHAQETERRRPRQRSDFLAIESVLGGSC
jgi:hypothetical protein